MAIQIPRPIRVKRQRVLKAGELERAVELAGKRAGAGGSILILLDANSDCPAGMGPKLLRRAGAARPDLLVRVVLAKVEPALTAVFNVDAARSAPSFDKMWRDVSDLLQLAGH